MKLLQVSYPLKLRKHIITIRIFGLCINGVTDKFLKFHGCWVIVAGLCF